MGKNSALINVLSMVALPVVGIPLALVASGPGRGYPISAVFAITLAVIAGILLCISKLPRIAAGQTVSFGPRGLPPWAQAAYVCGYAALLFSLVAFVAFLRA